VINFRVESRSGVPPYLQLVNQVRQALRLGRLQVGDQLPTVKEVVAAVTINPNTVLKAYRELERDGLVEGRPGLGTFVLRVPQGPPPGTQVVLARGLARWVRGAREAGLDDEMINAMMQAELLADSHEEGVA
jgi:GntR family transcriptional regulator